MKYVFTCFHALNYENLGTFWRILEQVQTDLLLNSPKRISLFISA
jgi:hypothetical protein